MEDKQVFSLTVPILSRIYNGLNKINKSLQLEHLRVSFPIHYVYGWIGYYFKTQFSLTNGPSSPLMVAYFDKGEAWYFDGDLARKHIHQGDSVIWTSTMPSKSTVYYFVDSDKDEESEISYFMILYFNFLPFRNEGSFILEPYRPHRFSH
ncbi:hypothetical protein FXO38_34420, partial [Capsicum annuum]